MIFGNDIFLKFLRPFLFELPLQLSLTLWKYRNQKLVKYTQTIRPPGAHRFVQCFGGSFRPSHHSLVETAQPMQSLT